MKNSFYRILLHVFFVSFFQGAFSQDHRWHFNYLTGEADFAENRIATIVQDRRGFLWMGSNEGLIKYDGYQFSKYPFRPFDSSTLSQNYINRLLLTRDTIWIGTPEGLCSFDLQQEKFTRYTPAILPGMPDLKNVAFLTEDQNRFLWISTWGGKLWKFDRAMKKFIEVDPLLKLKPILKEPLSSTKLFGYMYPDKVGNLWLATSFGLLVLKKKNNRADTSQPVFDYIKLEEGEFSPLWTSYPFEDHNGIIWVGSLRGLKSYNPNTKQVKTYLDSPGQFFSKSAGFVSGILEDQWGNIWFSTFDKGLVRLNADRNKFNFFTQDQKGVYGLKSNYIGSIALDLEGNLFLATDKGLHQLNLKQTAFHLLQNDPLNLNSLGENEVSAIGDDNQGNIWIGNHFTGLNRWNKTTGIITRFQYDPHNVQSLRNNYVNAILKTRQGQTWVANGEYLSLQKNNNGDFEHFNSDSIGLELDDDRRIYTMSEDAEGLLWLGTGNGIKTFDPVKKVFSQFYHDPADAKAINDKNAARIFVDSRNNIWIGTGSISFKRFDKKTRQFRHYRNSFSDTTSISSNIVKSIFEDSKGRLWLGTYGGGLCEYLYDSDKFSTHSNRKDIPWSSVFSIEEDSSGSLWLGTNEGLSHYNTATRNFKNFDRNDGLQSDFFAGSWRELGSSFKGRDGILYFGGINGLNYFAPADVRLNNFIPPVVITRFQVFDKLQPGVRANDNITLDYDENFFSFEFASLSYANPARNKYTYQLEGVDPDWIYSGSRRFVSYTGIEPGNYVFRVKGSNNDGIWNESGVAIAITVKPPWWRTIWAYLVYGLLLLAGILMFDRSQRRRVQEKERAKAKEKELEHAKQIEKAYDELKRTQKQLIQSEKMASLGELTAGIAHEIQNPLNFVNNFSDVNQELITDLQDELEVGNTKEVRMLAENLKENEAKINHHGKRADAIVKSMLQHTRASTGTKEAADINALADEYLRLAYNGLRAKDKNFNSQLNIQLDPSAGKIVVVAQEIGRVLLNLYNNAFYAVNEKKKLNPDGYEPTVTVSTKKLNDQLEIRINDNGNGIPEKSVDKIFQPFFTTKPTGQGTGLGLSLSYDIIKAHQGEIKVNNHPGEGVEFIITLPLI